MHFSAKRGIGIAWLPSVCPWLWPLKLEILETKLNCTDN